MIEIWKDIPGYEGLYQVSNLGRIKSILFRNRQIEYKRERILIPQPNGTGYLKTILSKNGIFKQYLIHRLGAMAFLPNPENLPQINHKDENKHNNKVDNLEWCTEKYNHEYGTRINREIKLKQEKYGIPVMQKDLNDNIIKCFTCIREANRETGVGRKEIKRVCEGIYSQAGGYKWSYING